MATDLTGVATGIDTLLQSTQPYTAKAKIDEGIIDKASTELTGDRTTDLFSDAASKLGKDDFLMLLVTQLQYQDPLSPMENTEFISQLAQFSALENSTNVEKAIGELGDSFKSTVDAQQYSAQSMNNTAAVSLIGKEVRMRQSFVDWRGVAGETMDLNVHLGNNASAVVEILDRDDNVIKTLETTGKDSENSATITWDGSTDTEEMAASGTYTIRIQGADEHPELYTFQQDVVEGVRFSSEGALVKIAGQELSIGNVLDVSIGNGGSSGGGDYLAASTAVSLLGKQVRMRQSTVQFNLQENEAVTVQIQAGTREYVQIDLTDSLGRTVISRSIPVGEDGIAVFEWNGETEDGTYAAPGSYTIKLPGESTDPTLYAFTEGVVSGISNLNSDTRLRVGSYTIPLSRIIDITDISEESAV
jgi:flagellar basal-body rod modification protein FlgD